MGLYQRQGHSAVYRQLTAAVKCGTVTPIYSFILFMSGHSKWAKIKRKKGGADAKRGAIFTRLGKNISLAAKSGADPDMNATLRVAIEKAKAANMPKDNIEKAIMKGSGEIPGVVYEEVVYEGYGPGGAALLIECVTDNTNRTVPSLRSTLTKAGGSLGEKGSVQYLFEQKGIIRIAAEDINTAGVERDAIELSAIDAGAQDIQTEEEGMTITTARTDLHSVVDALKAQGIEPTESEIEWITTAPLPADEKNAEQIQALIEQLEENEDVNAVYTNVEL